MSITPWYRPASLRRRGLVYRPGLNVLHREEDCLLGMDAEGVLCVVSYNRGRASAARRLGVVETENPEPGVFRRYFNGPQFAAWYDQIIDGSVFGARLDIVAACTALHATEVPLVRIQSMTAGGSGLGGSRFTWLRLCRVRPSYARLLRRSLLISSAACHAISFCTSPERDGPC